MIGKITGLAPDDPVADDGLHTEVSYAFHLLDPGALFAAAEIMREGAKKYPRDGWRRLDCETHVNHALGHLFAHLMGDRQGDHLGSAICRTIMAKATEEAPIIQPKMPRVYVCHPYKNAPKKNTELASAVARRLQEKGMFPVVPHLMFQYLREKDERAQILDLCVEAVRSCDMLFVIGRVLTDGMTREITMAELMGIPILRFDRVEDI